MDDLENTVLNEEIQAEKNKCSMISLIRGNNSKNKQMGLHQTKKLSQSEGNYQQNKKAAYWIKDIYKLYIQ